MRAKTETKDVLITIQIILRTELHCAIKLSEINASN